MTDTNDRWQFSRRGLLKSAVGTGAVLVIGFDVFRIAKGQAAAPVSPFRSWIRIDEGGVTLLSGRSEMGQGISSSLPMVLADELGIDWKDVRVEKAPNDPALFGDQGTGGSGSVAGSWMGLRQAGAAARTMLVATAAQEWNVAPESCTVKNGVVSHGNEHLKFSELVEGASKLPLPDFSKLKLKRPEDFKIIGKVVQRKDIPSKIDGSAIFGIDVRPPGMLYAMVERCPVFGGKVKNFDATTAKSMRGVHEVFEIAAVPGVHSWGGIAVVADSTWIAMQARKKLRIDWDLGPHANESSELLRTEFRRVVDSRLKTIIDTGNADTAIDAAPKDKRVDADYELPFQAHATMEPMNCTVKVDGDHAEVWVPAQGPEWVLTTVAEVTGLKPNAIKVNTTLLGGGFGRRYQADFAAEAGQVAKRVPGRPVQLIWSREDDMTHDYYRPASYHRLSGAVDAKGNILAWRHRSTSTPIAEWWSPKAPPESSELGCSTQMPYLAKSYKLEYLPTASGVPRAWWRSVEASSIGFVMESYVDELAHAAGKDPLEFRISKLDGRLVKNPIDKSSVPLNTARLRGVLQLAADKSGWNSALPQGHGRGIAAHYSFNSYVSNVAEVSVIENKLKVNRIVSAVDIGTPVSPDGIRAQVESAIIYGLTAALKSQITIKNGRAVQSNFDRFSTLAMNETPLIEVYIVPSTLPPTGIGEPGLPPTAPAVTNAIFAATGKRIRRLPMVESDWA
ncbi:MAG TPA: xanthine dehydrogenase family protein molybdopterin-binding subunit [Bryobacteraceae bacterium]|jgi:CO/xanthine dehydrogenase Mo-binding subunit|nr:xanthine dehydrogenase family protein molybdopterin-binding subunit [Bryobacteraceae bacterium]